MPLCECGCGLVARSRFLPGHNLRGACNYQWKGGRVERSGDYSYVATMSAEGTVAKYRLEHVVIAERVLGKTLPTAVVVHHFNGNKQDNKNSNLVICQNEAYHQILHRRTRAFYACGNANWMRCVYCYQHDDLLNMIVLTRKNGRHIRAMHRKCRNAYDRELYSRQKTHRTEHAAR
mgnify:FL=1